MPDTDADFEAAWNATPSPATGTPIPKDPAFEAAWAKEQTRSYDPAVQPGKYPISGPLDTVSQNVLEGPATTIAGAVGSAMDTFRRPVATLIAGQGAGKAWQNMRPQWAGGTPEDAPTPEQTKHTLGITGVPDKPGFNAEGDIDWGNVASSKIPNQIQNFGVQVLTDPAQLLLMGAKLGVSPAFEASQVAARDAFRAGTVGGFATREAAQAATMGKFSDAVAAGQAGAQFHIPLVGKQLGFVQLVPRGAAKWIKALDPVVDTLTKTRSLFTGPAPEDPAQLLQTQAEGRSVADANVLRRKYVAPMAEKLNKAGVPIEEHPMLGDVAQMLDEDGRYIRDETKPQPVPDRMQPDWQALEVNNPAVARATKEAFDAGPEVFAERRTEALAHWGTLPTEQQAALFTGTQDLQALAKAEIEMYRARGMKPNTINAVEKQRFPDLLREHNALSEELKNTAGMKPEEIAAKQARLTTVETELPTAARQFNAIPEYVPGKITLPTRELANAEANPNLGKARAAQSPDKAVRHLTLAEIDKKWKDYGEVRATVYMGQKYRGVGTPSTAGVGADYVPQSAVRRFFTKLGWKEYKAAESFFEADPIKGWDRKIVESDVRAMTNFEMDQHYLTRYMQVNKRATVQPIRQAAFDGKTLPELENIWKESGRTDTLAEHMDPGVLKDVLAGKLKVKDAITQSWTPYGMKEWEAAGVYKPEAPQTPIVRTPPTGPTTLTDMAAGLKPPDNIEAVLNIRALNDPVGSYERYRADPGEREAWAIGDEGAKRAARGEYSIEPKEPPAPGPENFMHAGALDELRTYQRLGSDPTGFTNWLRHNAPAYMQAVKLSKAFKTLWGPGAPGYIALKTMHDSVRGSIGGAWDLKSPGELTRNAMGQWKYADSGGMDVSGIGPYDFGPKNGGVLSGPAAVAILERTRALGVASEVAYEFQRGGAQASKSIAGKAGNAVTDFLGDIPGAGRKIENFIRGQDSNFRSAAVAKFMREGLSEGEAAFRMQKAFFDFTRQGPVTRVLSQSGAVPFAAWQSKIIPFMARWALERPGEFMLVQKVLNAFGAGQIPQSQVPQMIRNGTNMPVSVWKDRDGHTHFGIETDDGVIPGDELMYIARSPQGFLLSKSGDILRGLYLLHDQNGRDATDPEKLTGSDLTTKFAKTVLGHPAHVLSTLGDPEKTTGEKISAVFNPTQYNTFDSTKTSTISVQTAKGDVKRALYSINDANLKIRNATAAVAEKTKTMNQVQALEFLQRDPMYQKAQGELNDARARLLRERRYLTQIRNDVQRTRKVAAAMVRAP